MSKTALFNKEAFYSLLQGVRYVTDAVSTTLGPGGNTVVIQRLDKSPLITKDGVSVAKELQPKDERLRLGADLAISIAQKQMNQVGDGTSSATVLGEALLSIGESQLNLQETKINRTLLKNGLEKAKNYVIQRLTEIGKEIKNDKELINIATISANGDKRLGKIVADAYSKVGRNGVVLVEETKSRTIELEFKEGMTFNKGWTSQYFITNQEQQLTEFDNPMILFCNTKISNLRELVEKIKGFLEKGLPVVVIAESFDPSVINGISLNILRNAAQGQQLKVVCIEAPSYGERRLDILRDMALYTGGTVAGDPMGTSFENLTDVDFGTCEKIIVKKDETLIRGASVTENVIKERIDSIKGLISALKENDVMEEEQLQKRLAMLTTGVATIKVGGSSEEEIHELRDRLDDAQWAVKAALEEGYLPGAGNCLLLLSEEIKHHAFGELTEDEAMGITIFRLALKRPFETILKNAGIDPSSVMSEILKKNDFTYGYDARGRKLCNLLETGIVDPVKVVCGTVFAATSIAATVLMSQVAIVVDSEDSSDKKLTTNYPRL